jgi:hypothetical protein
MNGIFTRRTPLNNYPESLSTEKKKLLYDASLETLNRLYEKCYEERIPRSALIDALEGEIFKKTIKANHWKIDRIFRLEPKKQKRESR